MGRRRVSSLVPRRSRRPRHIRRPGSPLFGRSVREGIGEGFGAVVAGLHRVGLAEPRDVFVKALFCRGEGEYRPRPASLPRGVCVVADGGGSYVHRDPLRPDLADDIGPIPQPSTSDLRTLG